MAKYKVTKKFRDLEQNKLIRKGEEVEMTVTRADEINENTKFSHDVEVLERIDNKQKEDNKDNEEKETKSDKNQKEDNKDNNKDKK